MRAKLTMDQGVTGATALQQSSAKLTTCTTSTSVPRQYLRLGRVLGINVARLATQLSPRVLGRARGDNIHATVQRLKDCRSCRVCRSHQAEPVDGQKTIAALQPCARGTRARPDNTDKVGAVRAAKGGFGERGRGWGMGVRCGEAG